MKIQFEGGQIVEFDGQPTENDIHEVVASFEQKKPMFSSEAEGRVAMAKQQGVQNQAEFEASPIGFGVTQGLAVANRAINTATGNLPEIAANAFGKTIRPMTESDISKSVGDAVGFLAPTGAPMKAIEAMNVIKNPLTRAIAQGAGAMATQLPTADRGVGEYAGGVALGGATGVLGRGVEKVAEGALQKTAQSLSGRIGDYLVKLPTKAFRFSKDPMDVLAKESENLVAGSMSGYADKAKEVLKIRTAQLNDAAANSKARVDISSIVDKHLNKASSSLEGSLKNQTAAQDELATIRENLQTKYGDLKDLSVADAIKLKRQLKEDFPFTQENAGSQNAKAAHQIYHDIDEVVDVAEPAIKELNHRVSGLIDIEQAAQNRAAIEFRNNPFGLVGRLGAAGLAGAGLATGHGVEGLASGLAVLGFEKVINSPALLTRAAKALSLMSTDEKAKIFLAYPKLKAKVDPIKVDARDIEILPKVKGETSIIPSMKKLEMSDVVQKELPSSEKQLQIGTPIGSRKALPNLPAEGQGFKSGSGTIIPYANRKVPSGSGEVIQLGDETIQPLKVLDKGKGKTPIPRRGVLANNKGQAILPSSKKPQDFKTAEEYVASKMVSEQLPQKFLKVTLSDGKTIFIKNPSVGNGKTRGVAVNAKGQEIEVKGGNRLHIIDNASIKKSEDLRKSKHEDTLSKPSEEKYLPTEFDKSQLTSEWQAAQGKTIPTKKTTPIKRKGE